MMLNDMNKPIRSETERQDLIRQCVREISQNLALLVSLLLPDADPRDRLDTTYNTLATMGEEINKCKKMK